jgi:hypothetical protein
MLMAFLAGKLHGCGMLMKKYKQERAEVYSGVMNVNPYITEIRAYAINWGISAFLIILTGYIVTWFILRWAKVQMTVGSLFLCIPISMLFGLFTLGYKLMAGTEDYYRWVYQEEETLKTDLNGDGVIGQPDPDNPSLPMNGTFILGVDNQYHRIDTQLNVEELDQIKRILLLGQKATVRSLQPIIGERASRFREELIDLGICNEPLHEKASAPLSRGGELAVKAW